MAQQSHAIEHEAGHPSALVYVRVFLVLFVLTAMEVGAFYLPAVHQVLPFILVTLSALKFGLVAAFYMHLKFDNWLFVVLFVGGLAVAASLVLAFATLFGTWWQLPIVQGPAH